jgi:hypothetical protein
MDTNAGGPQAPEQVQPQKEHRWLQRLVGEWTFEGEAPMAPGQPPVRFSGTESVRPVGELWIVAQAKGALGVGHEDVSQLTLGFDSEQHCFVAAWIGSMADHLWTYQGELNPAETALTLSAEGPSMQGDGTLSQYRDVHEFGPTTTAWSRPISVIRRATGNSSSR